MQFRIGFVYRQSKLEGQENQSLVIIQHRKYDELVRLTWFFAFDTFILHLRKEGIEVFILKSSILCDL